MEDDNGDNNAQYIAPGGTGHQYNGQGHHIYSGPGMTINIDAATDTFGTKLSYSVGSLFHITNRVYTI
jgi:hypothetical protein